ncbi:hypothetical protein PanWU01x14_164770, partial [Parasponia andersonii]
MVGIVAGNRNFPRPKTAFFGDVKLGGYRGSVGRRRRGGVSSVAGLTRRWARWRRRSFGRENERESESEGQIGRGETKGRGS